MAFFQQGKPTEVSVKPTAHYFTDAATRALVDAALAGDLARAKQAMAAGGDPNARGAVPPGSPTGFSPLHYALAVDNEPAVRILVALGADPEREAGDMGMPLLFAITRNDPKQLALLLDLKPVDRLAERTQQHLLFESARRNAPGCLELLVQRGVPVDVKDSVGYTLLLRSIDMGDLDLTLWLLQRGAAAEFHTPNGMSPAYSIEFELNNKGGSPERRAKLIEIMRVMKERGAVFPAVDPKEYRAAKAAK
ncbi:hypothetical protein TSO352_24790 [Azospirillum sp. TSO35-2]|nr:hypothetical protein TSO352_24790 [Azospirillum sp. TSO35-2]